MNFDTQAKIIFDSLSQSDQELVQYIMLHKHETAFISITEFARKVHSSKSSVSRLAQKLGYRGFGDLKFALQESLAVTQNAPSNLVEEYKQEIMYNFSLAEQINYVPVLQKIHTCNKFIIFGTGVVQNTYNKQFSTSMFTIGRPNYLIESFRDMLILAATLEPTDLVMITSFSGQSPQLREIVNQLKLRQIPICSFTELGSNFLSENADYKFFYKSADLPFPESFSLGGLGIALTILSRRYMEMILYDE